MYLDLFLLYCVLKCPQFLLFLSHVELAADNFSVELAKAGM